MMGRDIENVSSNVMYARSKKVPLNWKIEDTLDDMEIVCNSILSDIPKAKKGNKSAQKRVRLYTKLIETLGVDFRVQSVK